MLSPYAGRHLETLRRLEGELGRLSGGEKGTLEKMLAPYLEYREETGRFFREHLRSECSRICFERSRSGCCGREGIIVFFADFVIERLTSGGTQAEVLARALENDGGGADCVYLDRRRGCLWSTKPVACEMFLCDEVREKVLERDHGLHARWTELREGEKRFTRPDRPVLFDDLERYFIERGVEDPLMFFHHSPGLLRMKRAHGVGRLERISLVPR